MSVKAPPVVFDAEVVRFGLPLSGASPAESLVEPRYGGEIRALLEITNPVDRHRAAIDPIVAPEDDYVGDHKEYILWPFARPSESRFSDGTYGVLYAGLGFDTALTETLYWIGRFFQDSKSPVGAAAQKRWLTFRATSNAIADVREVSGGPADIYNPNDYSASRRLGAALKSERHDGVYYDSVRRSKGECIGAFVPRIASNAKLRDLVQFTWDGAKVATWGSVNPV